MHASCRALVDASRRRVGQFSRRNLRGGAGLGDRHGAAFAFPDLEPLLREAAFLLLAQEVEEVARAADEAGERGNGQEGSHGEPLVRKLRAFLTTHFVSPSQMPHLLLVDDDPEALEWLTELAKAEGFTVAQADSLRAARIHMSRLQPDILLTDLQLPDGKGVDLVNDLEHRESTEVVMITGHASVESAVEALRLGATDYMVKPVDVERLKAILRRVPRTGELRAEIGELRDELRKLGRFGHILGSSPPMQKLYDQLGRVAPTSATVLITGESGTGKELAAQTIHDLSRRKKSPFLPLNCGAVSPQLIESELFGHEKGSFTGADRQHKGYFERAHGGTLFLDEITEMPQELQVKLLRVLETGTFTRVGTTTPISADVRVIAATNRSPEGAVADGKLREDLYHRLNVFPIAMPPLRERGTDIELLAQHFLDVLNKQESGDQVVRARPPSRRSTRTAGRATCAS